MLSTVAPPDLLTTRLRVCCGIAVCGLIVTIFMVGVAQAGSLALVSCAGTSANEGWGVVVRGDVTGSVATSSCSEQWESEAGESEGYPAGMKVNLPPTSTSPTSIALVFAPPRGESVVGGDITVAASGRVEPPYENIPPEHGVNEAPAKRAELAIGSGIGEDIFWFGVQGEPTTVTIPGGNGSLSASVLCNGEVGQNYCSSQALYVLSAHILLSPKASPSVSSISGPLTAAGVVHGTQGISFTASDAEGPGVYQVAVAIDGETIYQATPDLNSGVCAPVGTYGTSFEFYTANPCPQSVPMTLPIHTSTLPDGIHSLTVTATDAAGNLSSVSQVIFRSENRISTASAGRVTRPQNEGPVPAYLISLDGRTAALLHGIRRTYADSSLTLTGTLSTPQGAVAPDVPINLLAQEASGATKVERVIASTTTDASGHWSLTAPKGPSRTLRVSYSQASTASIQAGTAINESVDPTMSLRIQDQHGGRLTFTGRLSVSPLGHPLPYVLIEASSDGRHWQTVGREVRTDSHGNYKLSYSSPLSVGGRFAFRAITPETSLWLRGSTGIRWVKVR